MGAPSPRISQFSQEPGCFYWSMVLETKIWALGVLVAAGVSLLWALSNGRAAMHTVDMHTSVSTSLCNRLC